LMGVRHIDMLKATNINLWPNQQKVSPLALLYL